MTGTSQLLGSMAIGLWFIMHYGIIPKTEVKMTALSANMFIPIYIYTV